MVTRTIAMAVFGFAKIQKMSVYGEMEIFRY